MKDRVFTEAVIREATPREIETWDDIVVRFDNHRVFHKKNWIRSIAAFSGGTPLHLIFVKRGEIVGCLAGLLIKLGFLRLFGSPLEGWQTDSMGPAFDPEKITTGEMFSPLVPYLEKKKGVWHVELVSAGLDEEAMRDLGFRERPLFTYRVDLFPEQTDRVIQNMHRRTRTYVRSTIRSGLISQVETEESFVDEIYDQSKDVFLRHGNALPFSKKRLLHLFRAMKESGNLLALSIRRPDDGACMATGTFLVEGRELCLWSWTHRSQFARYHPIELLTWTAMRKGMEVGCTTFDMGGGGQVKPKFGAFPDRTSRRWIWSRHQGLFWGRELARKTFRWQQSLRGAVTRHLTL